MGAFSEWTLNTDSHVHCTKRFSRGVLVRRRHQGRALGEYGTQNAIMLLLERLEPIQSLFFLKRQVTFVAELRTQIYRNISCDIWYVNIDRE
jgi:hypothetical protein